MIWQKHSGSRVYTSYSVSSCRPQSSRTQIHGVETGWLHSSSQIHQPEGLSSESCWGLELGNVKQPC